MNFLLARTLLLLGLGELLTRLIDGRLVSFCHLLHQFYLLIQLVFLVMCLSKIALRAL